MHIWTPAATKQHMAIINYICFGRQNHFSCFLSLFLLSLCLSISFQLNPDYDSTFVFENDFPALQPDAPDPGGFQSCKNCNKSLHYIMKKM